MAHSLREASSSSVSVRAVLKAAECGLEESLLLIGYFTLEQPALQSMLLWGLEPTLLQRLCSLMELQRQEPTRLPSALPSVLLPSLVAATFGRPSSLRILRTPSKLSGTFRAKSGSKIPTTASMVVNFLLTPPHEGPDYLKLQNRFPESKMADAIAFFTNSETEEGNP